MIESSEEGNGTAERRLKLLGVSSKAELTERINFERQAVAELSESIRRQDEEAAGRLALKYAKLMSARIELEVLTKEVEELQSKLDDASPLRAVRPIYKPPFRPAGPAIARTPQNRESPCCLPRNFYDDDDELY